MIKYILLFICISISFFSCNQTERKSAANPDIPKQDSKIKVYCTPITNQTFQKQIVSNGKIEAKQKSNLRFKISNIIASIKVKNGQKVNKGQLLAILENDIANNQVEKTSIAFEKAKSQLQEEKINYGLDNRDSLSNPQVLRNLKMRSGYLEAENALKNARFEYNQSFIRTPFSGIIASIEIKAGDYITSNEVFCILIDQKQFTVKFSILENELSLVKINQQVTIALFSNIENTYSGIITEINPLVDENGLVQVKANISNVDDSLLDGMSVKIHCKRPLENIIVIPKEALVLRSNREVVFTVEDGLAKWNYVEVQDENSYSYAIKSGLKLGDTIIISGNMNLSHGAGVNPTLILNKTSGD